MEQADIFKITMTVEEARRQLEVFPENSLVQCANRDIATRLIAHELTPAQAQAVLVLAWNRVLDYSHATFRRTDAKCR